MSIIESGPFRRKWTLWRPAVLGLAIALAIAVLSGAIFDKDNPHEPRQLHALVVLAVIPMLFILFALLRNLLVRTPEGISVLPPPRWRLGIAALCGLAVGAIDAVQTWGEIGIETGSQTYLGIFGFYLAVTIRYAIGFVIVAWLRNWSLGAQPPALGRKRRWNLEHAALWGVFITIGYLLVTRGGIAMHLYFVFPFFLVMGLITAVVFVIVAAIRNLIFAREAPQDADLIPPAPPPMPARAGR